MEKKTSLKQITLIFFLILIIIFLLPISTFSQDIECKPNIEVKNRTAEELSQIIDSCSKKLNSTKATINTLSAQINYMNTQIYITKLKIAKTNEEINTLKEQIKTIETRIDSLDQNLTKLSQEFLLLTQEVYKLTSKNNFSSMLLAQNFSDLLKRYKYLKTKLNQNKNMMLQIQKTKLTYEEEKQLREEKQKELEFLENKLKEQEANLRVQQEAKRKLLEETRNDERIYQRILSQARAEYQAIVAIVAGKGEETFIKKVSQGEAIATVIPGPSCNSNGAHLHLIIKENGTVQNPFNYLSPVDHINCSGSFCGSEDGDPFNPSGNYPWPLEAPIILTQGYGSTWATRNTWVRNIYTFHNGIDIKSNSYTVKSIFEGDLYRGSFSGSGGCALPYVKVKNENLEAYYLHVYSKY